jgi:hypothetical protein
MALGYSLHSVVDFNYSAENIKAILCKGQDLGFIYRKIDLDELDPKSRPIISIEEAVIEIMEEKSDVCAVIAEYKDTFFYLFIHNYFGNIELMFSSFRYPWFWKQDGKDTYDLDLIRYIRLMADLIEDHRIINFIVERD